MSTPNVNILEKLDILHESFVVNYTDINLDEDHIVHNGIPGVLSRGNSKGGVEDEPRNSIDNSRSRRSRSRSRSRSNNSEYDHDESLCRGRSNSIDSSNSRSRRGSIGDDGDFQNGNPVFQNPRYPDMMNTKSNSDRFIAESRSQYRRNHKILASSGKKFWTDPHK